MKTIIIITTVFLAVTAEQTKFAKYSIATIPEYGAFIEVSECSDEVLMNFHYDHPDTTDFLIQFQLRRNFLAISYNMCMQKKSKTACIDSWRVAYVNFLNKSGDEIIALHPTSGEHCIDHIVKETQKCFLKNK